MFPSIVVLGVHRLLVFFSQSGVTAPTAAFSITQHLLNLELYLNGLGYLAALALGMQRSHHQYPNTGSY